MATVSRLPIIHFVFLFVGYVVCHGIIGILWRHLENRKSKEMNEERRDELVEAERIAGIVFKWFPAIYVIFLLIVLS